jgi:coenzyme F420-0:L-glutamate ligase/coenzyme F420-1:gamma-L-glutamate ligase
VTERPPPIRLVPLAGLPEIRPGDDLAMLLRDAACDAGVDLAGNILVVCQKVISKVEGRFVALAEITPSPEAERIAMEHDRDPRQVEVVLRESRRIVRRGHGVLISETRHGFVCANAGVDLSNAPGEDIAVLLPVDPDASARRLSEALSGSLSDTDQRTPVIVTDTFGRPWREGLVDVALGSAGLSPIRDDRGSLDRSGRELVVTRPATADQLAAAAGLLMWKGAGVPAVVVEGYPFEGDGSVRELLRDPSTDLFK